jgi:FkbM family methyltransferase
MHIPSPFKNTRYKIYKFFSKIGLLPYINISALIRIDKEKIRIPIISGIGYQNIIPAEEWAGKLYKKLFSAYEGVFIDVGVNNGQTLIKIKAIDGARQYFGFEPNPACYNYTRKLIQINNFSNCLLFPVGLSNQNIILPLYHDTEFASGASVLPDFRENKTRYKTVQQVALMCGDEVISNYDLAAVSILKADVEGAELEVIEGLQKSIQQYRFVIVLEILPVYSIEKANGKYRYDRQQSLLQLLASLDYKMYLINEQNVSLVELDKIEVHSDMSRTNYLFVPNEKIQVITSLFF